MKIKSKWKAEKRRLGSSSKVEADEVQGDADVQLDIVMEQDDATHSSSSGEDEPLKSHQPASDRNAARDGREGEKGKGKVSERTRTHQDRLPRRVASSRSGGRQEMDNSQRTPGKDDASLRELFRKAYSRESLHTYKSDPLHRGKGRPSAQHRGGARATGRGQPDMKLRMNALLEKIKRDVAAG